MRCSYFDVDIVNQSNKMFICLQHCPTCDCVKTLIHLLFVLFYTLKLLFWTVCDKWSLLLFRSELQRKKNVCFTFLSPRVRVVSKCTSLLHPRQHFNKYDVETPKITCSTFRVSSRRWRGVSWCVISDSKGFRFLHGMWWPEWIKN